MSNVKFAQGQVMIITIVFLAVVLILAASLFSRVAGFLSFNSRSIMGEQAHELAEAGVDHALWQLNETAGSFTGQDDVAVGTTGTFTTEVENKSPSIKTITSTGYVPASSGSRAKRTIKVDAVVDSTTISFRYAVQVGTGGVEMENSATINGSVYSNGNISGENSSRINGDAWAVGTISTPPVVTGQKKEFQPLSVMPTIIYQNWKDAANVNNNPITCSPTCTISTNTNIGPRQYNGNLEITNNAIVTMDGPIYVTGNFSMLQGGTTLKLNESFGSAGTVFIVDGTITLTQGGNFEPTSASPKGYILVVTTSTNPSAIRISQHGATAIFYALEGKASLSQTANVTALVAKTLEMENSATLNYDIGLPSASFTTGPGGSWLLRKGTYRFTSSP